VPLPLNNETFTSKIMKLPSANITDPVKKTQALTSLCMCNEYYSRYILMKDRKLTINNTFRGVKLYHILFAHVRY
jgi:hypothetical protein